MIRKISLIVNLIRGGKRIDVFGGVASPLKMVCDYLKKPQDMWFYLVTFSTLWKPL